MPCALPQAPRIYVLKRRAYNPDTDRQGGLPDETVIEISEPGDARLTLWIKEITGVKPQVNVPIIQPVLSDCDGFKIEGAYLNPVICTRVRLEGRSLLRWTSEPGSVTQSVLFDMYPHDWLQTVVPAQACRTIAVVQYITTTFGAATESLPEHDVAIFVMSLHQSIDWITPTAIDGLHAQAIDKIADSAV